MSEATPFDKMTGDQRALTTVISRYTTAEKSQSKQMSNFDSWQKMYKGIRVKSNYKGTSNITVPKVFEKVERGTAILSQAIKRIRVNGQGVEDKPNAELNERLIEFEDRVMGIARLRKQWIKSARIHGISYLKATWNLGKEEPARPYKGIDISMPSPKNIFYNPDWTPDKPFRWAIDEEDIPYAEVAKNPMYKAKLDEVKKTSHLGNSQTGFLARRQGTRSIDTSDTTTLMTNIREYYGPYAPKDGDEETSYKIVVANKSVVLEAIPNPYDAILDDPIPIFALPMYIVPHEAAPMGDPEAIESLYTELNDTRNQRLDTVTLNIDPAKEVLRAANIQEADLIARKGWVIHSNIPNGVRFIPPDMQGVVASIQEERIIQGDIDRTLGIPSFGSETPVTGDITTDTATGVNATLQAQDIISNSLLEEVKYAMTKFYRAILAFNQAFIDRKFTFTLIGEDQQPTAFQADPERLKGNMDLDVEVELVGNRLARRAEALQALTVGSKVPGTNMAKLWEDYLYTHDKYNTKDYYTPPQPPPPEPPKVSVSLSGQLNQLQSSQAYKAIPGVNPMFADPVFTEEGRNMMRGDLPEHGANADKSFEQSMKQKELAIKEKSGSMK